MGSPRVNADIAPSISSQGEIDDVTSVSSRIQDRSTVMPGIWVAIGGGNWICWVGQVQGTPALCTT